MIELRQVSAGYGEREVLHQVDAQFTAGQVTAVIGPNGCGKSTLLKTIARVNPAASGEILVDGISQPELTGRQLAQRVAYLPQSRNTPDITVQRMVLHGRFPYLSYPRRYREEDLRAARQALEWVGAEELADRRIGALSGGQRQKVYIAMALAQDTGTVLMDEPTTYLDLKNQLEVLELAGRLAHGGKAVVLVLHDLDAVLRYADRVVLLDQGRVVCSGAPRAVFSDEKLERVFGLRIRLLETEDGVHCCCSRRE